MKFRWLITYDEFGMKSEPELQYWDDGTESRIMIAQWLPVNIFECKIQDEEKYSTDGEAY